MNKPEQAAATAQAAAKAAEGSLLDKIVEEGRFGREATSRERGKDMVKEFIAQVVAGEMTLSRDADATINARIAQVDHLISLQLNEVLHHPALQKLEATWRGLKYLLDQSETGETFARTKEENRRPESFWPADFTAHRWRAQAALPQNRFQAT